MLVRLRLLPVVLWSDIRGTAVVEAAIMLPVLFILVFGVFEFSWFFYEQHRVSTGIRDAARYIARSDNLNWASTPPTIPDAVKSNAQNLATTGDTAGGCTTGTESVCRVRGWSKDDVQITAPNPVACITVCQGRATTMQVVTVSTSFQETNLGFLGLLKLSPFLINVSHSERLLTGGS
jgi:Flp pilus assembly protein TadG